MTRRTFTCPAPWPDAHQLIGWQQVYCSEQKEDWNKLEETHARFQRSLNALRFLVYNAFRRSCEWRRARVGLRPSEHISNVMQATNSPEQQICIIPETQSDTEKQWTQSALINLKNTEKGYFRQTSNCCRVNISVTDGLRACFLIRMNSQTN